MTDFCGIPLVSLRENSITELNLGAKGVGVPGAIVLSKLLPSAAALTSLKCAAAPRLRFCFSARWQFSAHQAASLSLSVLAVWSTTTSVPKEEPPLLQG